VDLYLRLVHNNGQGGANQFLYFTFKAHTATVVTTGIGRIDTLMGSSDLIGYGRAATGGAAAQTLTVVTNTNDSGAGSLRAALESSGPRWIVFDDAIHGQTITWNSALFLTDEDVTIDGAGANMTIDSFDGDDALALGQGNKTNSASRITVSNSKFVNTSKGVQAGGNDTYPDFPECLLTIFKTDLGAKDRNPRCQYGMKAHIFNCYIHSFQYGGMDSGRNAIINSENNVIDGSSADNPTGSSQAGRPAGTGPTGYIYSNGDSLIGGAVPNGEVHPLSNSPLAIPYPYTLMPASDVVAHVQANAGSANA